MRWCQRSGHKGTDQLRAKIWLLSEIQNLFVYPQQNDRKKTVVLLCWVSQSEVDTDFLVECRHLNR